MSEAQEPRELTPVQMFWGQGKSFKDFSVNVHPADEEVKEVEEAITPAPKDSSVPESVTSGESPPPSAPAKLESPALPGEFPLPTEALLAAVKASGKPNESSEDEPATAPATTPEPETSSSSSSSETNPGSSTPPASTKPPVVASPPVVPTTQT